MRQRLFRRVKPAVRQVLKTRGTRRPWVVAQENTPMPRGTTEKISLFAIIGTWHEADVVYATVQNAFAQGCDRVFIVDNNSPDNTVEEALSAGAILARSFETAQYDRLLKRRIMNEVILDVSQSSGLANIWWLWLDNDEFPEGPSGLSVKEFLATLHPKFRVVGARNVNHFPVDPPYYIQRFHPLEFQPWCEEFDAYEFGHCSLGHWKHPLVKQTTNAPFIAIAVGGAHKAVCNELLIEPTDAIILHHFPYRDREATYKRLEAACAPRGDGTIRIQVFEDSLGHASGMRKRYRNLDNVYSRRWEEVDNLHLRPPTKGVNLRLWERPVIRRWYTDLDLRRAKEQYR